MKKNYLNILDTRDKKEERFMNYDFRLKNNNLTSSFRLRATLFFTSVLCLFFSTSYSQVQSSVDTTSIKIGEQITYKIQVEADTLDLVVFPETQTFAPLEVIEFYKTDTIKSANKFKYIKEYALTQFDSGSYTIPRQKIIVANKNIFIDSIRVEVNNVEVDTVKQGLFDIKPIIEVEKSGSNWWKWLLGILLALAAIGFLLWWFIWREKPLTEEEKVALLPPYDRAKLALQQLDEKGYLANEEVKKYYSDLTFVIRKYLDEKVYDHSLESTTDQLIDRLTILREGNQIDLSKETIKNIESILKRADLVKFAKSKPDIELAKLDRVTIDSEIDAVKATLPEPTEEEKLLDEQYREAQERKQKRRKVIITVAISVFLLFATLIGFGIKYGFGYVKDTIIGHESKELLEGDWVTSEYGVPPVYISTPKVLRRFQIPVPEEVKDKLKMTSFMYGTLLDEFSIVVNTTTYNPAPENGINLEATVDASIKGMEAQGAKNIIVKNEQFITPNAAEGLKTYGTLQFDALKTGNLVEANYAMFHFTSENVLQQIIITYPEDDEYADQMVERIVNSIELKKEEEPKETK